MDTSIVNNLSECEKLWKKFRKDENIWTEWEIVLSFFDEKIHAPHFILLKEGTAEVGLITLWLDKRDNKYTHFGGERMENRTFWIDEKYYPQIHSMLPDETYLFDMNGDHIKEVIAKNPQMEKFVMEKDTRFFLHLETISSEEDFLARFSKKHRKNLLRDLDMLESHDYKLIWDHANHAETLMQLSRERFKEESDFHDEDNKKEMNSFLELLARKKMLHSLTIEIDGNIEGVEIAAKYRDHYYVINGGFNPKIKNLGKLLIIEHIKKAIELGAEQVDFLVGDTGWKDLWNLDKEECLTIIKDGVKNEHHRQ
ncbi:MAG: GNAT family N-acetyltransferase [Candidatus Nanoarchaeia archaeon]